MKNRKKIYSLVLLTVLLTLICSSVAFASGLGMGSDATVDILGGDRFSGAVQWVNKIGKIVDNWFMAFISFVSFFIISASCLRNVLAGAYCVFPKFWDKVYEAHQNAQDLSISSIQSYFTGGGWKGTSTGSVTQFLLRLLPNIKVLTDFENAQDPDYKQYFMRAIPQCVVAVFVGVFIYNGYYRDVMIVTSQFGSRLTMNALTSVKPDDILYKLSNISGIPDYPIKGAETGTDHIADTYLRKVIGNVGGEFPDQAEKQNKAKLYSAMSEWCHAHFQTEFSQYADTSVWSVSVDDRGITSGDKPKVNDYTSADGMTVSKYVVVPIHELKGFNSEYHKGEQWWLSGMVTMKNKGASADASQIVINDFILTLPYPVGSKSALPANGEHGSIGSSAGHKQSINNIDVKLVVGGIEFSSVNGLSKGQVYGCEGLRYESTTPQKNFDIIGVKLTDDGSAASLSSDSTGITIPVGGSVEQAWLALKNSNKLPTESSSANQEEGNNGEGLESPEP